MRELHRRGGLEHEERSAGGAEGARLGRRGWRSTLVTLGAGGILAASACTDTMDRWEGFRAAEGGEAGRAGEGGSSASAGDSAPSAAAGGTRATGGAGPEGAVGGGDSGEAGENTGGVETGGVETGGVETGGIETGGVETGGVETGGERTGGAPSGGQSGEASTGGDAGAGGTAGGLATAGTGGSQASTGGSDDIFAGGCCMTGGSGGTGGEPDTGGSGGNGGGPGTGGSGGSSGEPGGGGADVAGGGGAQSGAGGSSGATGGDTEAGGGTGGALVFPILERAVLRDSASGDVSESTTFVSRGQCGGDPHCVRYDALGLSLPQHDVLELYVRVGPAHLSSEHCWVYDFAPNAGMPGWRQVDGGCAEYVTEAGDLGTLVRQEHAVDATFSAQHDKDVTGPAPFLALSHFEDGAHQYIWVYSAAAP